MIRRHVNHTRGISRQSEWTFLLTPLTEVFTEVQADLCLYNSLVRSSIHKTGYVEQSKCRYLFRGLCCVRCVVL
jgi:hypothetical protein